MNMPLGTTNTSVPHLPHLKHTERAPALESLLCVSPHHPYQPQHSVIWSPTERLVCAGSLTNPENAENAHLDYEPGSTRVLLMRRSHTSDPSVSISARCSYPKHIWSWAWRSVLMNHYFSCMWLVVDRYIGRYWAFFKVDTFFCLADVFEAGLLFWRRCLSTQHSHSPSCSLSSLTVLSNTDRSLSNNQIERLNKGIKMYAKYYNDHFYISSNRKANIIILSRLPSAHTHLHNLNKSLND